MVLCVRHREPRMSINSRIVPATASLSVVYEGTSAVLWVPMIEEDVGSSTSMLTNLYREPRVSTRE